MSEMLLDSLFLANILSVSFVLISIGVTILFILYVFILIEAPALIEAHTHPYFSTRFSYK